MIITCATYTRTNPATKLVVPATVSLAVMAAIILIIWAFSSYGADGMIKFCTVVFAVSILTATITMATSKHSSNAQYANIAENIAQITSKNTKELDQFDPSLLNKEEYDAVRKQQEAGITSAVSEYNIRKHQLADLGRVLATNSANLATITNSINNVKNQIDTVKANSALVASNVNQITSNLNTTYNNLSSNLTKYNSLYTAIKTILQNLSAAKITDLQSRIVKSSLEKLYTGDAAARYWPLRIVNPYLMDLHQFKIQRSSSEENVQPGDRIAIIKSAADFSNPITSTDKLSSENIIPNNYDVIYENGFLTNMGTVQPSAIDGISTSSNSNILVVVGGTFAFTYDKEKKYVALMYKNNKVLVLDRECVYDLPSRRINYVQNVIESYSKEQIPNAPADNSLYLRAQSILNTYTGNLWNTYFEDIDDVRITTGIIATRPQQSGSTTDLSFTSPNGNQFQITGVSTLSDSYVICIASNQVAYVFVLLQPAGYAITQPLLQAYKVTEGGSIPGINMPKNSIFPNPTSPVAAVLFDRTNSAITPPSSMIDAIERHRQSEQASIIPPTMWVSSNVQSFTLPQA